MKHPVCSLILCSASATRRRLGPPARESVPYLCDEHWALLNRYDEEYAACYAPLDLVSTLPDRDGTPSEEVTAE